MGRDTIERVRRGEVMPRSRPPFATIPTTILASTRVRLMSGTALRTWLWCEACWTPASKCVSPVRRIGDDLNKKPLAVCAGLKEVAGAGLIVLAKKAVRPGYMWREVFMWMEAAAAVRRGRNENDMHGEAAVYDIPHRHKGAQLDHRPGDRRLAGSWKCYSSDLRRIASTKALSDGAIRTFVCLVLPHSRTKHGELQAQVHLDLSPRAIMTTFPDISRGTAKRIPGELVDAGLVTEKQHASGRNGAVHAPSGASVTRIQRGRIKAVPTHQAKTGGMACTRVSPNEPQSGISPKEAGEKRRVPVSVPPAANDAGTVVAQMGTRKPPVVAQMGIQEKTAGSVTKTVIEEKAA